MQVIFILSLFVLFSFFLFEPHIVFQATQSAVKLWAQTIVPSMLPFFILNNVLFAAGGIRLFGDMLSRPVKKLLGLPGDAAFILTAGYSTGVPVSASLIAELRKENRLSRKEGNRLLAYSANVSPAFILSAVAVSMLGAEEEGPYLAAVHYGTNFALMILCSFLFRWQNEETRPSPQGPKAKTDEVFSVPMIIDALFKSIRTIFLIGGVIIIFFILIAFLDTTGMFALLSRILTRTPEQQETLHATVCGWMEITAGAQKISGLNVPFPLKRAVLSGVLAFGGLSALTQIVSQIQETDLSVSFYLRYKIIQGALAFTVSLLFPLKTEGVLASLDFAHSTPLASHIPIGCVFYGIAVFSAILLIFRRLYCAEQKRRIFSRYSAGFHHGFFSRCKALYRDCFQSDKEHR